MSWNAGVTEDEYQHNEHGKRLLAWYMGKDNTAVKSPFDDTGRWKTEDNPTAINIYGGFFDLLSAFLYKIFFHRLFGEFEFRHILSSLFGVALLIFTGLISQRLTRSWAVALLTIVIATCTPRLIGNSLSNPKDIPLATFFAFSLLQIISFIQELPAIRIKRAVLVTLSFILAMAVRSGAIILIFYFILFAALYAGWLLYTREIDLKRTGRIVMIVFQISILGYLGCSLLWPWDLQNPVWNPILSLKVFQNFSWFDSLELFEGKWLTSSQIPWYFVPKWLYITLPVSVIIGLILYVILLPAFRKGNASDKVVHALILFSVVFPIVSIIIKHSNIYNGARHILFIVPPVIVMAAIGWAGLYQLFKRWDFQLTVLLILIFILAEPALFILCNNPLQAMYFSPLVGGTKGAFKNYEMDYWGYSIKPAIDWIEENDTIYKSGRKAKVRLWYGEQFKLSYYTDKSNKLQHVEALEESPDWDYFIQLPAEAKFSNNIIYNWPPKGTVYEVKADGAPLCAVIKNFRVPGNSSGNTVPAIVSAGDSATYFLNLGIAQYNSKDYNKAIIAFKKVYALDSKSIFACNNLVATYNQLKMFDDAIVWARKGLVISPDFEMLKNNLNATLQAKQRFVYTEGYYLNISYNYFQQGDYMGCIQASKLILKYNPKNPNAWNNICSAYNQLGQYKKALDACNQGIKLDPKSQILQNNALEAAKKLSNK